jgi:hypothetical protein
MALYAEPATWDGRNRHAARSSICVVDVVEESLVNGEHPPVAARKVTHLSPEERVARGRAARNVCPLSSHGRWEPAEGRPDPISPQRGEAIATFRGPGGRGPATLRTLVENPAEGHGEVAEGTWCWHEAPR